MEVSSQLHALAALLPRKSPLVSTRWEAGWTKRRIIIIIILGAKSCPEHWLLREEEVSISNKHTQSSSSRQFPSQPPVVCQTRDSVPAVTLMAHQLQPECPLHGLYFGNKYIASICHPSYNLAA
jgi:hypothetical protein